VHSPWCAFQLYAIFTQAFFPSISGFRFEAVECCTEKASDLVVSGFSDSGFSEFSVDLSLLGELLASRAPLPLAALDLAPDDEIEVAFEAIM
jgi:hypothetical protein